MARIAKVARVEKVDFHGKITYIARCDDCNWSTVRNDKELAKLSLRNHVSTRNHKYLAAAPYRFTV